MADVKITDFTALSAVAVGDLFEVVDISDTTDSASGTSKKITWSDLVTNVVSAAKLTTARSIYGNSFDGTADLTQIIASTYGGTGNGFTKFSGPASSEKTFTLPNASATILTSNAAVTAAQGGTGIASYAVGDILYASGSTTLSKLAGVATGNVLISGGLTTAPSWGKVDLTTHITGNLPVTNLNSGTSASSTTFWRGDATWATVTGSMSIGGSITSATAGSVLYAGTSGVLAQTNAGLFFDATNKRLGVGQNSPTYALDVADTSGKANIHLSATANTDSGAYIMSNNGANFFLTAGLCFNGTSWQAKDTTGGMIGMGVSAFGDIAMGRRTGMTAGSTTSVFPPYDLYISPTGTVTVNGNSLQTGQLNVTTSTNSTPSVVVKATGSQTAELLRFVASGGSTLSGVDVTGRYIQAVIAGTPSDSPANGTMVYDTSANKIWVYNGSWRGIVLV